MSSSAKITSELIRTILIDKVCIPTDLEAAVHRIMLGEEDPVRIAGLLVALASLPLETSHLVAGAKALRAHRVAVDPEVRPLIDTCGTGGDGTGTFNISTCASLVVAAAGAAVAKHGNRGVSSKVGSADVLEAAGCNLELDARQAKQLLDATGFAFLFAPAFHPAMRHVGPVRKTLGVRTLFNLLGPLANPALAEAQLLGVFDASLTGVIAAALQQLGSNSALVVHCAGMDEIGLHDVTRGHLLRDGVIETFHVNPSDYGCERAPIEALAGGDDAETSAGILREVLGGGGGPKSDVVALNAGAALFVGGRAADLRAGVATARELLASGAALRVLDRYGESSNRASDSEAVS